MQPDALDDDILLLINQIRQTSECAPILEQSLQLLEVLPPLHLYEIAVTIQDRSKLFAFFFALSALNKIQLVEFTKKKIPQHIWDTPSEANEDPDIGQKIAYLLISLVTNGRKEKLENLLNPSLYSLSINRIGSLLLLENMKDALEYISQLPNNIQEDIMLSMVNLSVKQHLLACYASNLFLQKGFIQHSFYQDLVDLRSASKKNNETERILRNAINLSKEAVIIATRAIKSELSTEHSILGHLAEFLFSANYKEPAIELAVACFVESAFQTSESVAYWICSKISDIDTLKRVVDLAFQNKNPSAPSIFILADSIYSGGDSKYSFGIVSRALELSGPWTRCSVVNKFCELASQNNMRDLAEQLSLKAFQYESTYDIFKCIKPFVDINLTWKIVEKADIKEKIWIYMSEKNFVNVISCVNTHEDRRSALLDLLKYLNSNKETEMASLLDNFVPVINNVLQNFYQPESLDLLDQLSNVRPDLALTIANNIFMNTLIPKVLDDFNSQRVCLNWMKVMRDVYAKSSRRVEWQSFHYQIVHYLKVKAPSLAYQISRAAIDIPPIQQFVSNPTVQNFPRMDKASIKRLPRR